MSRPRFELLTRPGCHLCDEMATILDEVLPGEGLEWNAVDVDESLELQARFGNAVPVLLRDGRPVAKLHLDGPTLRRIIRRRRWFDRRR